MHWSCIASDSDSSPSTAPLPSAASESQKCVCFPSQIGAWCRWPDTTWPPIVNCRTFIMRTMAGGAVRCGRVWLTWSAGHFSTHISDDLCDHLNGVRFNIINLNTDCGAKPFVGCKATRTTFQRAYGQIKYGRRMQIFTHLNEYEHRHRPRSRFAYWSKQLNHKTNPPTTNIHMRFVQLHSFPATDLAWFCTLWVFKRRGY